MIEIYAYLLLLKEKVEKLKHVKSSEIKGYDLIIYTHSNLDFEIYNIHFNEQRLSITFDYRVFNNQNVCIGNSTYLEFEKDWVEYYFDETKQHRRENIRVRGHRGNWYEIYNVELNDQKYYVMEHEFYGEDANHIVVDEDNIQVNEDLEHHILFEM